jgi:hypothetical protein
LFRWKQARRRDSRPWPPHGSQQLVLQAGAHAGAHAGAQRVVQHAVWPQELWPQPLLQRWKQSKLNSLRPQQGSHCGSQRVSHLGAGQGSQQSSRWKQRRRQSRRRLPQTCPPQQPVLHPVSQQLAPQALATGAGAAPFGASAAVWPANQAVVTNKNAAFTRFSSDLGLTGAQGGFVEVSTQRYRQACALITTVIPSPPGDLQLPRTGWTCVVRCLMSASERTVL